MREFLRGLFALLFRRPPCGAPGPGDWRCVRPPHTEPMHWDGNAYWHGSWEPEPNEGHGTAGKGSANQAPGSPGRPPAQNGDGRG